MVRALVVPLRPFNMIGLEPLRALLDDRASAALARAVAPVVVIAASIATALAHRGLPVHLSTTDPAAHAAATIAEQVDDLKISCIDPVAETKAYVARELERRSAGLDEAGRALIAEDLRSPCYEEVAVFTAFSRIVSQARTGFVVLDTAPTGHTLLLLDATGSYHRQLVGRIRTIARCASSRPS